MKNLFILLVLFSLNTAAYSQQMLPDNLSLAVKDKNASQFSLELNPDLSYYSQNYNQFFGYEYYTFDVFDYGARNIYVGQDNRFFYSKDTPHIFTVMPMAGVNVDAFYANPCKAGYGM